MASTIQDVMSTDLVTCPSTAPITDAARLMRDRDIGDVLVTRDGDRIAGIVSLGDLAMARDEEVGSSSALGDISAAEPNN